jgi:ribosomal protein S18 acetylase RimI-like enzyme
LKREAKVTVRPGKREDAGQISALSRQLGYPSSIKDTRKRLDRIGRDREHAFYVAELPEEKIVGWVHVYASKLVVADSLAQLGGLVIDQRFRSMGIGRMLLEKAESWARTNQCSVMIVRSNVVREDAHDFYEYLGYRHMKTQHTFRKSLSADSAQT